MSTIHKGELKFVRSQTEYEIESKEIRIPSPKNMRYIIINNKINDDDILFNYLLLFCKENDASIDFENLKTIENSKYYLTYIYKYLF